LRTGAATVDASANPTTPPKPANVVAVETRFVGVASDPTTPPKAPTPPAIVEVVEVVADSEVAVDEVESVAVEVLESNPTTPPNAPTPPATVELATSVVAPVESRLVEDVVSEVVVLDSVLTIIAPATPPKPPCPPATVTTEPAVGAVSVDKAPATPPNPAELETA
jgi:hypothetical protein